MLGRVADAIHVPCRAPGCSYIALCWEFLTQHRCIAQMSVIPQLCVFVIIFLVSNCLGAIAGRS